MSIPRRRPAAAVFVIAALLACCPALAAQSPSASIHALIDAGKLDQALQETNAQLAKDKDNINYLFLKGLVLTKLDHLDQAEAIFTRLTREHPDLPEPYNNLAVIYASRGEFDKARKALQEAINTHPSYATAHENLGDIYAKMASRAYSKALQLDKENTTAKAKLSLINDLFSVPGAGQAVAANTPETPAAAGSGAAPSPAPPASQPPSVATAEPAAAASAPPAAPQSAPPPAAGPATATAPQPPVPQPAPKTVAAAGTAAPTAAVSAADRKQAEDEIRQAVTAWVKDWSSQDVDAYLADYAGSFTPPENQSRQQWKKERKERLKAPRYIHISISDLDVKLLGADYGQATFTQDYQSDTYSDRVTKLLLFTRERGDWRIVQEATK